MGVPVSGWDPAFFPDEDRTFADVVNLGYVVNVIEHPEERVVALCAAWELTQKLLIVSARLDWEARTVAGDFYGDGIVTGKQTFQKFFAQDELRGWIDSTIGRSPVAAAPGVFYVFRDTAAEQTFLAHRATRPRRRIPAVPLTDDLFRERRDVLQPLIEFLDAHGRLPVGLELEVEAAGLIVDVFGSISRAFALLRRITAADRWEAVRAPAKTIFSSTWRSPPFRNDPSSAVCPTACGTTSGRSSARTNGRARKRTVCCTPRATSGSLTAPAARRRSGNSCVTRCTSIRALWGICIPCFGSTRAAVDSSPAPSTAPPW